MRRGQNVNKGDLTLFYVAMRQMANPQGFSVVGRIDPLIHSLDAQLLCMIRRQPRLTWSFDLGGHHFQNSDLFTQKRECAGIVQEFLRERVNEWKIRIDSLENELTE